MQSSDEHHLNFQLDQAKLEYARQNSAMKARKSVGMAQAGDTVKMALNEIKINMTQKFEAQERRRKMEYILLGSEPGDRTQDQVKTLRDSLVTEFRIFKELASEGKGMEDEVTMIAKNHLSLVRTFEQKSLTEEVSDESTSNLITLGSICQS